MGLSPCNLPPLSVPQILRYFNVTLEQFPNSPLFLAQQLASEKASIVINYRLMEVQ